ncbi:MAG: hypothetical protein ACMUEL_00260 [Flavobacteriales bacterium Tduv]
MIVNVNITVSPFTPKGLTTHVMGNRKEEGKSKSVKKRKGNGSRNQVTSTTHTRIT